MPALGPRYTARPQPHHPTASEEPPMYRDPALRRLSSEHHTALVLAKRAREALAGGDPAAAWETLQGHFAEALEPHFLLEEGGLLPVLAAAGESALVARTRAEHKAMRELIHAGGPADLVTFAGLLADHIRFEEKELFAAAQRVLDAGQLAALAALHADTPPPACPIRDGAV